MMKIDYSLYELIPVHALPQRQGALLRVTFPEGRVGYADCHPWPELGDKPLQEQLELLKHNQTTSLSARSLHFARLDAQARSKGHNLFEGLTIPPSHYLLADLDSLNPKEVAKALDEGFTHFKVKVRKLVDLPSLATLTSWLPKDTKLRLDFNHRFDEKEFREFMRYAQSFKERIDFCEDPFPFVDDSWKKIQREENLVLACDRDSDKLPTSQDSAKVIVLKSAVQDEKLFQLLNQRIVVTSYLDHPFGQLTAAYVAAQICQTGECCGLLSHKTYKTNAFSAQLKNEGTQLIPPQGTGFGFDEELKEIKWEKLK